MIVANAHQRNPTRSGLDRLQQTDHGVIVRRWVEVRQDQLSVVQVTVHTVIGIDDDQSPMRNRVDRLTDAFDKPRVTSNQ